MFLSFYKLAFAPMDDVNRTKNLLETDAADMQNKCRAFPNCLRMTGTTYFCL